MSDSVVSISSLSKRFVEIDAVHDLSLDIDRNFCASYDSLS